MTIKFRRNISWRLTAVAIIAVSTSPAITQGPEFKNFGLMALMTLYRTRADGVFTDQEAFFLRALSLHVNYAYFMMSRRENRRASASRTLEELTAAYRLTRREEEILGMVFREQSNDEILDQLAISRHTLHKHLQNLYRKCGVSSRLGLLKLRTG